MRSHRFLAASAFLLAPLCTAAPEPAPAPGEAPAAPAAPKAHQAGAAPTIHTADDLLAALEKADEGVRTLSADVRYDRTMKLAGDRHIREGRLYFVQEPAAQDAKKRKRSFGVHFDTLLVGERLADSPQVFVFDGVWFVEKRAAEKRYTKREVARAGDDFDPLKVGEGPMPLPIGQKAADIKAKYRAELLDPADGLREEEKAGLPFLSNTWQLRLTPHPVAVEPGKPRPREEFKEIRLWYQRDTLLPRLARTTSRGGDESFVVLLNLRTNETLPPDALDASEPPADAGWDVQVERLGDEKGPAAAPAPGKAPGNAPGNAAQPKQ